MAQLSKVLKVVCWAGSVIASEDIKQKQNEPKNGSVPLPPVSLQRQVVCLTVAAAVHVFSSGESL